MEIKSTTSSTKDNEKVIKVLQKFLEPNFKVKNDVYLNKFLTHIVGKNDNGKTLQKETSIKQKEHYCQWIVEASNLWDGKQMSPPATILSFALNLASQLSGDEQIFVGLNCKNIYEKLVGVAQKNSTNDPSVTLGLVTLLCSFLEHKSGVQWVMATTYWSDMVCLGLTAHTMYIRKKAHQFVIKLLEKTISFNRNFSINLVGILVQPLKDFLRSLPFDADAQNTHVQNREIFESLKPSLDFVTEVSETLLKSFNKNILQIFMDHGTTETVEQLHLLSQTEDFCFELLKIQFVFLFYKLCIQLEGVKVVSHDSITIHSIIAMFNLISNEMNKNNVRCIIKICDYAHALYCSLALRLPLCVRKGETIEFQNQMVLFQLMPIMILSASKDHCSGVLLTDDFRREFCQKLLKMAAIKSLELCFKWKISLMEKDDLIEDATFSLQYLVKTKKLLNKERAATMFPALVYSLNDTLNFMHEAQPTAFAPRCIQFLSRLLETIVILVESFDLTWKDSIETIRVMDLACDFVQYPTWNDKRVVIKGLKLLNTAISKYMSPDMVLLIYDKKDCKVSQTGTILYAKCHDSSWEIRDSALEVVCTLSINANSKFPAYTTILLDAELPQLVVNMALKDGEFYVRATAFRCLQELIQIQEVWDVFLTMDKFLENLLSVFENETEGIVRKEAATLMCKIVKFQSFPEEILPRLYDVMTHAATGDLYWEVKYNALDFWCGTTLNLLSNQGMIDRMFPTHTFSKELKKIVTLTEAEVRKRIVKVLHQLSDNGCLHVIKCAIQDDCDIEVSKKATEATLKMLKLFIQYKVYSEDHDVNQPPGPIGQQNPYQPLSEPITPANSVTHTDSNPTSTGESSSQSVQEYPSNIEDLGSPKFSNSPFFDPVSPFSTLYSPSTDFGLITPPQSVDSQTSSSQRHMSPSQTTQFNAQQDTVSNGPVGEITPSINLPNGSRDLVDLDLIMGDGDVHCGITQLDISTNGFDPANTDNVLDEFLKSNDMTLLQKIYNPTDQVTNNTTQMKKKTYLSPSHFLKFVYNEVEAYSKEKTEWLKSLDEFDSLLDDILKEYNVGTDVNTMDCY